MHDTAFHTGAIFFQLYAPAQAVILDVGAMDLNGSLRACAPAGARYVGVDMEAGRGVDIVLQDPYAMPFPNDHFDLVVSSSCLEHDAMFWIGFIEFLRVLKPGGFLYMSVPTNGWYHRHPIDAWRCYPDAGLALEKWGRRQSVAVTLIESFVVPRDQTPWNDFVMVFAKGDATIGTTRMAHVIAGASNIRTFEGKLENIGNFQTESEDMQIIKSLNRKIEEQARMIANLVAELNAVKAPGP
jgi:SAM-dependent methyltransferase